MIAAGLPYDTGGSPCLSNHPQHPDVSTRHMVEELETISSSCNGRHRKRKSVTKQRLNIPNIPTQPSLKCEGVAIRHYSRPHFHDNQKNTTVNLCNIHITALGVLRCFNLAPKPTILRGVAFNFLSNTILPLVLL